MHDICKGEYKSDVFHSCDTLLLYYNGYADTDTTNVSVNTVAMSVTCVSVWQCVAVSCNVLQCVAVCCSV